MVEGVGELLLGRRDGYGVGCAVDSDRRGGCDDGLAGCGFEDGELGLGDGVVG